jgi:oligopeptide transport system ATP-binding protein
MNIRPFFSLVRYKFSVDDHSCRNPPGWGWVVDGALLEVTDLRTEFVSRGGVVRAVDDVSFTVGTRETLAIVGESGSGKSATALSLLRLIAPPVGRVSGGIRFADVDVLALDAEGLRRLRGRDVAMVFQDPMTSLNPVLTVGLQLTETLSTHLGLGRRAARARATELLDLVGIPDARRRLDDYPHQFSGGMRQRVMIAMALSCAPKLLIADEPTTALDVTIQAQILELLKRLRRESGTAILLITHDLGVVAGLADRVAVMYAGQIVEMAPTRALFADPRMPYTWGLLDSMPRLDARRGDPLLPIRGSPPDLAALPPGCRFAPRCAHRRSICTRARPDLLPVPGQEGDRLVRCWGAQTVAEGGWLVGMDRASAAAAVAAHA